MLEMNATGVFWLQALAEVHAKSKIHSAFSHEGKTNTCEPSLAPLNFSVRATIGYLHVPSGI